MKRLLAGIATLTAVLLMQVSAFADDAQIAKQIIERLRQERQTAQLQGFDIGVQVDKGTVTVMGQVADSRQAMLALDVARRVPDVKLVVNDLYIAKKAAGSVGSAVKPAPAAARPASDAVQVTAQMPLAASTAPTSYAVTRAAQLPAQTSLAPVMMPQPRPATAPIQPAMGQMPVPVAYTHPSQVRQASAVMEGVVEGGYAGEAVMEGGYGGSSYDNPSLPGHAWPSYSAYPNYGAVSYPNQYSATAWPYIGPFYPYPQVPLGWRKVMLEWDDGWWWLDFRSK